MADKSAWKIKILIIQSFGKTQLQISTQKCLKNKKTEHNNTMEIKFEINKELQSKQLLR